MAGIFLLAGPMQDRIDKKLGKPGKKRGGVGYMLHNLVRAALGVVCTTLGAMVTTIPLTAVHFGSISLIAPVTNLLTLWAVSAVFAAGMAVGLLGMFVPGVARVLSVPVSALALYVEGCSDFFSGLTFSALSLESPYYRLWLGFVYLLLIIGACCRRRRVIIPMCSAVVTLCAAIVFTGHPLFAGDTSVTVLDVGQGQSILLQSEGRSFLVDCGGDSDTEAADKAAEILLSRGVESLDGMILTHLDRDHAGGAENLLQRMDCGLLILPDEENDLYPLTDRAVVYAREDLELTLGNAEIRIYAPTYPGTGNEKSLCVLFDTEKCDILITGDRNGFGERMLLRNADIPDVDVLVAGHHGSKHSSCEELLMAVRPEIVCISVGKDNSYGHPAPELLTRLEDFGCTVYRTDIDGSIIIRR